MSSDNSHCLKALLLVSPKENFFYLDNKTYCIYNTRREAVIFKNSIN